MTAQVKGNEGLFEEQIPSADQRHDKPPLIGVLLIHGLNGNPSDLAEMASVLQAQGMVTTTMRLPGHGEQGCEMAGVGQSRPHGSSPTQGAL